MKTWIFSFGHFLVFIYPILTVVIGLIIGIISANGEVWILTLLMIFLFTGKNIKRVFLLLGIGFGCGYTLLKKPAAPTLPMDEIQLFFKIKEIQKVSKKSIRCRVTGQWKSKESHPLILYFPPDFTPSLDTIYTVKLRLQRVEGAVLPGGWSYADYLARQGIFLQGFVKNIPRKVMKTSPSLRQKYRSHFLDSIENLDIDPGLKHLMQAMIWGDRSQIDPSMIEDFRRSGLMHILAISGSHLALLFWVLLKILWIVHHRFRKYKIIFALAVLWGFSWLVGLQGSVLRASLMLSFYYLSVLLERRPDFLQSCLLSIVVILCLDPWQLYDVGFQLSYAAVLGMYFFSKPIFERLDLRNKFLKYTVGLALAGVGAQLGVTPILLYHFHQMNLLSVMTNIFMVPLGELVIFLGFLQSFLGVFFPSFLYVALMFEALAKVFTSLLSHLGFGLWEGVAFGAIEAFLLSLAVVCIFIYIKNKKMYWLFHSGFCLLLMLCCHSVLNFKESQLHHLSVHEYRNDLLILDRRGRQAIVYAPEAKNIDFLISRILPEYAVFIRGKVDIRFYPKEAKTLRIKDKVLNLQKSLDRYP